MKQAETKYLEFFLLNPTTDSSFKYFILRNITN